MKNFIAIVDYGMGNLYSVARALKYVAPQALISIAAKAQDILDADRIILPGQGAMPDCVRCLHKSGLFNIIKSASREKPLLGICIGEQILFNVSDEGNSLGMSILPGKVVHFKLNNYFQDNGSHLKVPQIGWNRVYQTCQHPLWDKIPNDSYFYFVHSYHVIPDNPEHIVGKTKYGYYFTSAVASGNIFATQFHPEKSAKVGLQLYYNFVNWRT